MKLKDITIYTLYILFLGFLYIYVFEISTPDPGSRAGGGEIGFLDLLVMGLAFLPFWLVAKLFDFVERKRSYTITPPYVTLETLKNSGFIFNEDDPFWIPLISLKLPPKYLTKLENLKSSSYVGRKKRRILHSPSCEVLKDKVSEWDTFEGFNSIKESENLGFRPCKSCLLKDNQKLKDL